jgi:hypothetical protein
MRPGEMTDDEFAAELGALVRKVGDGMLAPSGLFLGLVADLSGRIESLRHEIHEHSTRVVLGGPSPVSEGFAAEARAVLRGMDPQALMSLAAERVQADDRRFLRCIEGYPAWMMGGLDARAVIKTWDARHLEPHRAALREQIKALEQRIAQVREAERDAKARFTANGFTEAA